MAALPLPSELFVSPPREDYEVLDRLIQKLQSCRRFAQTIGPSLESVVEGSGADLAFVYTSQSGHVSSLTGPAKVPAQACKNLALQVVGNAPSDREHLLWVKGRSEPAEDGSTLRTAVASRIGNSPNWVVAARLQAERPFQDRDLRFVSLVAHILVNHHAQATAKLRDLLGGLVQCLTRSLEAKDPYTAGHSERVARIGVILARELGLDAPEVSDVFLAGLVHDIGKIGIQDTVLQKAGPLDGEERAHIREHVIIGEEIVSSIKQFSRLRPGVRNHHEHYDGTGYPDRLKRERIPFLARLLTVADACDAMMSPRRYRSALTPPQIDAILQEHSGKQFDPELVEAFMACRDQIYPRIYQKGVSEEADLAINHLMCTTSDSMVSAILPCEA
jgi:putative nucleotidyltransferase with HDIG domain